MFVFKDKYYGLFNAKSVLGAISFKTNPQKHWILSAIVKEYVYSRESKKTPKGGRFI